MSEKELAEKTITVLTELFGPAVFRNRDPKEVIDEIGIILVARKMFGTLGDSGHAQVNKALNKCKEELDNQLNS